MAEAEAERSSEPPRYLRRDAIVAALVFVAWIVPISEGALFNAPGPHWPRFVRDVCSISCLFRSRPVQVTSYHLQVQREGGAWEFLRDAEFFPMEPFGHRTRFDRFMERWAGKKLTARDDLVRWLVRRDRELHPEAPPIVVVRFVAATHRIHPGDLPQGAWRKPDPTTTPTRIDSTHPVDGKGRWR